MISLETLPEGLVARCLDVLRKLSSSERDLIRLIVEVIQELRDLTREEEPEVFFVPFNYLGDRVGAERVSVFCRRRSVYRETRVSSAMIRLMAGDALPQLLVNPGS